MGLFDTKKNKLAPRVFLPGNTLRPSMQLFILDSLFKLIPAQLIHSVQIVGSILGYHYDLNTDIDIQAQLTDKSKVSYYSNEVKVFNRGGANLIGGHPVNYFVLPRIDSKDYSNLSSGLYDVINNKWVVLPKDRPVGFEKQVAQSQPYLNLINREMGRQLDQLAARPNIREAKDVADIYHRLDQARKTTYAHGIGVPRYTDANVQYKSIEKSYGDIPERIHRLIRKLNA